MDNEFRAEQTFKQVCQCFELVWWVVAQANTGIAAGCELRARSVEMSSCTSLAEGGIHKSGM